VLNRSEKYFQSKLKSLNSNIAPGFHIIVAQKGKKVIDVQWGQTWKYYDLASLTKILFTVPVMMSLVSERKIELTTNIQDILGWFKYKRTIQQLLTHTAGNEWWLPFFKKMDRSLDEHMKSLQLQTLLKDIPLKPVGQSVYSDLDFFLLGFIMQDLLEKNWRTCWTEFSEKNEINTKLHFNTISGSLYQKKEYAPTEYCPWRKKILQAEVDDENAWSLGGAAPHAGLFGSADDVLRWGLWLRKTLVHGSAQIDKTVARTFAQRAVPAKTGDWSLGFMMPTVGASSAGKYFSSKSIGHTGFTGTSFWFDPTVDVMVILLSNRIHPTRKNSEFKKARPIIHDFVMESLKLNE
jgi:serine-type D-Ala-D-Ala carboxypeptidase